MARAQPFDSRTGPCICRLEPSWWVRFHLSPTRASNYIDAYTGAVAVNGRVHRRQHLWVLPHAEIVVGAPHRHLAAAVPLQPAATITGISAMPSCRAASILAWPAIRPPSSPTSAGVVQPHSLMLAAIAATWASVWVRAFLAYGISRSIAQRSTLSAGHGL